jgi:hypothetical protein
MYNTANIIILQGQISFPDFYEARSSLWQTLIRNSLSRRFSLSHHKASYRLKLGGVRSGVLVGLLLIFAGMYRFYRVKGKAGIN